MTDSPKPGLRCPMCGETQPEPTSLCLGRYLNFTTPGQPCEYSVEGQARTADMLSRARAAGVPVEVVGGEHVG